LKRRFRSRLSDVEDVFLTVSFVNSGLACFQVHVQSVPI
jgi:hypothetical protein